MLGLVIVRLIALSLLYLIVRERKEGAPWWSGSVFVFVAAAVVRIMVVLVVVLWE